MDGKTAAGETLIYFRAVMAQGEVSQTSERTTHAMRALKAKGIACGALPYGKEYSDRLDAEGRRVVVEKKWRRLQPVQEPHSYGKGIKTIADIPVTEGDLATEERLEYGSRAADSDQGRALLAEAVGPLGFGTRSRSSDEEDRRAARDEPLL